MNVQEMLSMEAANDSEQIPDSFVCPVCLELLYKPIILACGHVSCFWCVHRSMSFHRESHCPICRHAYQHFPSICQMLHFLLMKMYPVTYKRRSDQILEMEKATLYFSPTIDSLVASEPDSGHDQVQSLTVSFQDSLSLSTDPSSIRQGEACANASHLESSSYGYNGRANSNEISTEGHKMFCPAAVQEKKLHHRSDTGTCGQVSVADVLCAACKQLLYRPVAINCGHVYCEACIVIPSEGKVRCQVCESSHPMGFPKVCLELHHFLEEQFSSDYAQRKGTAQLKQVDSQKVRLTVATAKLGSNSLLPTDDMFFQWLAENDSNFHAGVGCDSCGMCPIIGERYRCKDCKERMGFDLCGDCYNTRSKLPGRFNQQHTPEHQMEAVKSCLMLRLFRGQVGYTVAAPPPTADMQIAFSPSDAEDGQVSPDTPTDSIDGESNHQSPL